MMFCSECKKEIPANLEGHQIDDWARKHYAKAHPKMRARYTSEGPK